MADPTPPQVELRGITKLYGQVRAVDDVSLKIPCGQFVVLLGPSGSGKTTVLSIIGGFVREDAGQVLIGGNDMARVAAAKRPTTTVFQDYALFPHMKVAGNVAFGLAMQHVPRRDRPERVEAALKLVGLANMGTRRIDQLSGGQRQRVALARALVVEPDVLLLDEPLGALDLNLRRQMQDELVGIQKQIGTTFVHVTHDQDEAMNIADLIVVMNQGRIEDVRPPERMYLRPRTRFVANFMGNSNLIEGRVIRSESDAVEVETAIGHFIVQGSAATGQNVHLAIRPEQIELGEAHGDMVSLGAGRIRERTFQGTHIRVRAAFGKNGEVDILLILPAHAEISPGDEVPMVARNQDIILLME